MGLKSIESSSGQGLGVKLVFIAVLVVIAAATPYLARETFHRQKPEASPVVIGTTSQELDPVDPLGELTMIDGATITPTPSPKPFANIVKDTATDGISSVLGISTGVLEDAASKSAETATDFALRQAVRQLRDHINTFTPHQQEIIQEGICVPPVTPTAIFTPTPADNEVVVTVTPTR